MLSSFDPLISRDPKLVLVTDFSGRQIIGVTEDPTNPVVELDVPMMYMEGRTQDGKLVVNIVPISLAFPFKTMKVAWTTMIDDVPMELKNAYNQSALQLRAASAGITLSSQMPPTR